MNIVCFIISAIVFFFGFVSGSSNVMQQTVQYIVYLTGSLFLCTGFILTAIKHSSDERSQTVKLDKNKPYVEHGNTSDASTWICKKCGAKNPASNMTCKDCGEYK
jgi:predicted membrane protein